MVAVLLAGLLLPMFSRMLKYNEAVEPLVKTSFTLLCTLAIIIACGCYFYGTDMIKLLYNADTDESTPVFKVLMCCFLATSTSYVFSTLLTANGNLKQLSIIAGAGMVLNLLLNFIFIPHLKALGSACVSLFTQLFVAIIQVYLVQRLFKFHTIPKLLFTLLVFAIGEIAINFFSRIPTGMGWKLSFMIMVFASGIWGIAIGLLNIKSLVRVLKYE
jgi:O-antigen/teichoic acid export membrane protein